MSAVVRSDRRGRARVDSSQGEEDGGCCRDHGLWGVHAGDYCLSQEEDDVLIERGGSMLEEGNNRLNLCILPYLGPLRGEAKARR